MGLPVYQEPRPSSSGAHMGRPCPYGSDDADRPPAMRRSPTTIDAALELFGFFSPRETKQFFDRLLESMSAPAKEALIQVIWNSLGPQEKEWFDLPRRPTSSEQTQQAPSPTHSDHGPWSDEEILCGFAGTMLQLRTGRRINGGAGHSNVRGRAVEFGTVASQIPVIPTTTMSRYISHPTRSVLPARVETYDDFEDEDDGGVGNVFLAARERNARQNAEAVATRSSNAPATRWTSGGGADWEV
ncbi:hypothetical protein DFS34DRAFT_634611, partial [Phlyctochytrium arcticum]